MREDCQFDMLILNEHNIDFYLFIVVKNRLKYRKCTASDTEKTLGPPELSLK